jgi:hypothetical protein
MTARFKEVFQVDATLKRLAFVLSLGMLATGVGCTHSAKIKEAAYGDVLLMSSDGRTEFPIWAYNKVTQTEGDRLFVSGGVDIAEGQSPSRGLEAADLMARSNLAKEVMSRFESQAQYAAEGLGLDESALSSIANLHATLPAISGIRIEEQWYAKVLSNGPTPRVTYRCFTRLSIDIAGLKAQVQSRLRQSQNLTPEFRARMNESWDRFFGSTSDGTAKSTAAQKGRTKTVPSELIPTDLTDENPAKL